MKYRRIALLLILVFFTGTYLVADNLNRQLSCQAAAIFDVQVLGDSVQVSAFNTVCSVKIPFLTRQLEDIHLKETMDKGGEELEKRLGRLYEEALVLYKKAEAFGHAFWDDLRNHTGKVQVRKVF